MIISKVERHFNFFKNLFILKLKIVIPIVKAWLLNHPFFYDRIVFLLSYFPNIKLKLRNISFHQSAQNDTNKKQIATSLSPNVNTVFKQLRVRIHHRTSYENIN